MILWHAEFQKQCVNSPAYIIVKQYGAPFVKKLFTTNL